MLKRGDRGPEVAEWQRRLVKAGYDVGRAGIDGIFGPDTAAATTAFQAAAGLPETGIADRETQKRLGAGAKAGKLALLAAGVLAGIWFLGQNK